MNYPPLTAKKLAEVKRLLKKSQIPELEYREYEYEVRYEKEMRELELQKDKIKSDFFNCNYNPIRESVRVSTDRDPDLEDEKREQLGESMQTELERLTRGVEVGTSEDINVDTVKRWGLQNNKYNAEHWIPPGGQRTAEDMGKLYQFWDEFIETYENEVMMNSGYREPLNKDKVFNTLLDHSNNKTNQTAEELKGIQTKIERMTMYFYEANVYESLGQLKNKFINIDEQTAKDYLLDKLEKPDDLDIVRAMGTYTLECIVVFVLSKQFNVFALDKASVQVATLVSELDSAAKIEYNRIIAEDRKRKKAKRGDKQINEDENILLQDKGVDTFNGDVHSELDRKKKSISKQTNRKRVRISKHKEPGIGEALFGWLASRKLIEVKKPVFLFDKKNKKPKNVIYPGYVDCLFDIKDLPFCSTLPMVYPPADWELRPTATAEVSDPYITNLTPLSSYRGGYLTTLQRESGDSPTLLSEKDYGVFDIHIDREISQPVLSAVKKLQRQPYRINKLVYDFIQKHWSVLVSVGLLRPKNLALFKRKEALRLLSSLLFKHEELSTIYRYSELKSVLLKNIHASTFELYTMKIAEAYLDYKIYFPIFLDFRGRNYRHGPFHFHERDLVRSLIIFDESDDSAAHTINSDDEDRILHNFLISAAYHKSKFGVYQDAMEFISKIIPDMVSKPTFFEKDIFMDTLCCRHPFQYISSCISLKTYADTGDLSVLRYTPVSQDASASAYQMMSYFLLDIDYGIHTNLLKKTNTDGRYIRDIYEFMRGCLINYLIAEEKIELAIKLLTPNEKDQESVLAKIVSIFDRNVVKKMFMPMMYGKTDYTLKKDVEDLLKGKSDSEGINLISKHISTYWKVNFGKMKDLMDLINYVSWFGAGQDKPVVYSTPYWVTLQTYKRRKRVKMKIQYETTKNNEKEVKTTSAKMLVPLNDNDIRKSSTSTFANFIHQKDAFTAIQLVEFINKLENASSIPIYAVHDNFITMPEYAWILPTLYRESIFRMGHPLIIINKFLFDHILLPAIQNEHPKDKHFFSVEERSMLYRMMIDLQNPLIPDFGSVDITKDRIKSIVIPKDLLLKCFSCLWMSKTKKISLVRWESCRDKIIKVYMRYTDDISSDEGVSRWLEYKKNLDLASDPVWSSDNTNGTQADSLDKGEDDYCIHY